MNGSAIKVPYYQARENKYFPHLYSFTLACFISHHVVLETDKIWKTTNYAVVQLLCVLQSLILKVQRCNSRLIV